ncbi:MAG TPA: SDR family oxidoreductase [Bacteroidia bacterium]|nr:SDR family oxidoreductase [Bacteroidia bacterium]
MKIAVTGATGQLGRIVIEKLKEKIDAGSIVALVRSSQKAADLGVEIREADYDMPELLGGALQGVDVLVLISGSEVGKRILQHTNVIEAAQKAGVKRIVYTSLLHADRSSLVLAGEHIATETLLKNAGIPFTILRNGWYSENYAGSVTGGLAAGAIMGSAGDGKISSASRKDYAEAIVAVVTTDGHQNKVYELAGDEAFTMADLAAEISKQSGKDIAYTNLPLEEYASMLVKAGLPEGIAQMYAGIDVSTSKGDLFDDSHQLSKLIGHPTTPLKDVVAQMLKGA